MIKRTKITKGIAPLLVAVALALSPSARAGLWDGGRITLNLRGEDDSIWSSAFTDPAIASSPSLLSEPAPVDGETDWNNAGGTTWSTAANWTGVGGGSAPPSTADVAWFKTAFFSGQPNLTASTTIVGLFFNGTGTSGYDITSDTTAIKLTLTAIGAGIASETSNISAVAIGAQNTSGTNTIDVPVILGATAAPLDQSFFQAGGGTLVINGVISEATAGTRLDLSGAGTFTLNGANTYTGGTAIAGGTLNMGNNSALGTGPLTLAGGTIAASGGSRSISNAVFLNTSTAIGGANDLTFTGIFTNSVNSTLTVSNLGTTTFGTLNLTSSTLARTLTLTGGGRIVFGGVIQNSGSGGTGSLTFNGSFTGTALLNGANTYTGTTTLNAGTVQLGISSTGSVTNGPVGTGTLALNGGTLSSDSTTARSIANPITLGGNVTLGNGTNSGALTLSGAGTLTGSRTLTLNSDVTYSGNIGESGGSFGITKNGPGTLTLSGNNNYSGGTTANDGLLWVRNGTALGSSSGSLTVNAGTANGAIVDLSGNSISVGNLTGSGGNIWNNLNGQNTTATLTIGTGNTGGGNYQGVISNNNGASNGIVALTKTGTGTITLSGANTYSGGTLVNGGGTLLLLNPSGSGTGTGSVIVSASGTTLAGGTTNGTGGITGAVNVNSSGANLSPGTSGNGSGTTAILHTGALTLASGSNFNVDLNNTTAGTGYDQLSVTGTVNLGGTLASNLVVTAGAGLAVGDTFTIVQNDGTLDAVTGTFAQGVVVIAGNNGDIFAINYAGGDGNDIVLTLTALPEPSTWIGGALALGAIGWAQRKRFAKRSRVIS